jgi:spectrin beta
MAADGRRYSMTDERRISLQQEREDIQKRTFTRWVNSFLRKVDLDISDLFKDLTDGVKLLALLEVISATELEKPSRGKLRLHKIENVSKALGFLRASKVKLENISAENIVEGNPRLTLGLIWTLILRFQIQEIRLEGDAKSAKDALLYWCQKVTRGYDNVRIENFTTSWKDGLGFNAIIHSFRYDILPSLTVQA